MTINYKLLSMICTFIFGAWQMHAQGQVENAINFDGANDYVDCGTDASLDITGTTITLEAWVKMDVFTPNAFESTVLAKTDPSGGGYILRVGGSGQVEAALGSPGNFANFTSGPGVISLNTWQHIALTYDGANVRIYVEGNEVSAIPYTTPIGSAAPFLLSIGDNTTFTPRYFTGSLDEVRIWNVTRTAAQINTYQDNELCDMTGLVAYYRFNQGVADGNNAGVTTLTDEIGTNNGTINGLALNGTTSNWVSGIAALGSAVTTGTDTQVACDSYTWIDGMTYTTSNSTATDTLMNAAGCDSIVTLDLTINNSSTGTDTQVACDSYTWTDGMTYTTSNNTATQTLTNAAGCDSIVTLDLTINTVDVSTTVNDLTATVTATATGATYQWIDCSDNSVIAGETNQSYTPAANGSYAVIVTENNCTDTSACATVSTVGIDPSNAIPTLEVYPNPTTDYTTIALGNSDVTTVSIVSLTGQEVYSAELSGHTTYEISLNGLNASVYIMTITNNDNQSIVRLVKQ